MRLAREKILQDMAEDPPTAGCMGSGGAWDAGGGYGAYLHAVSLHHQRRRFPGALGRDLPQPGTPWVSMIGSYMDHR